jgi:putative transposase
VRLSQERIDAILRGLESGRSVAELAKENGVSLGSIYMWRAKVGTGHGPPDAARLSKLGNENTRLKCLVADLLLENQELKEQLTATGS